MNEIIAIIFLGIGILVLYYGTYPMLLGAGRVFEHYRGAMKRKGLLGAFEKIDRLISEGKWNEVVKELKGLSRTIYFSSSVTHRELTVAHMNFINRLVVVADERDVSIHELPAFERQVEQLLETLGANERAKSAYAAQRKKREKLPQWTIKEYQDRISSSAKAIKSGETEVKKSLSQIFDSLDLGGESSQETILH